MAKKIYGDSNSFNQTGSQKYDKQESNSKIYEIFTSLVLFVIIGLVFWYFLFGNKQPDDENDKMIESTKEQIETDETFDANNPFYVGIVYSGHHYTYDSQSNAFINDDDAYDIIKKSDGIDVSKYACSLEDFDKAKQDGFVSGHGHFSWDENKSVWYMDDDINDLYEMDGNKSNFSYIPEDAVIAKSIYHVILTKNYDKYGFIHNDRHYEKWETSRIEQLVGKWVSRDEPSKDETIYSDNLTQSTVVIPESDYVSRSYTYNYFDEIPYDVLSRTKELYKQYGFDYKGYHHSYDEKSDKWICDDNASVTYDYDSIPNDIDIVWLKESL